MELKHSYPIRIKEFELNKALLDINYESDPISFLPTLSRAGEAHQQEYYFVCNLRYVEIVGLTIKFLVKAQKIFLLEIKYGELPTVSFLRELVTEAYEDLDERILHLCGKNECQEIKSHYPTGNSLQEKITVCIDQFYNEYRSA